MGIVAYDAGSFLQALDAKRESDLGGIGRIFVDPPEDYIYERGYKFCQNCGRQSRQKMALDGKPYFCHESMPDSNECQAARKRHNRRRPK